MTKEKFKKYLQKNILKNIWKRDFSNSLHQTEGEFNVSNLFYTINGMIPNVLMIDDFDCAPYFEGFIKDFEIKPSEVLNTDYYTPDKSLQEPKYAILFLTNELFIKYKPTSYSATIFYSNKINP